ncbi:hypothetical protein E1B28_010240 [Marasmius oreades]|uniref:BTB domain-containing protein n=1 Tax=Marasmius oreades TaxID=181124 RepID=A0A9P7UTF5_9AGAR|nr:uncharacterized protein E1B28_010240 [Marasmius oreades]KAG7091189.1 hypothetical protein E1B28_010240 [Marasmius oreades]
MSDYGSRLRLEKSEKYMITGGDLHLTAGNTLYRVHRYFFERESPKFKEILGKPTSPGQPKPGSTPTSAILLEVTSEELDKFLWVFYNPTFSWDAPVEDWASILYLASLWRFPHVKAHALRELEQMTMPLIDKIALFQKCSLDEEYLVPLYGALCARDAPLSIAESEKLGVQTAVIVFQAREALRAHSSERGKSPLPEEVEDDEIVDTIRDILKGVPHSNRKSISLSGWVEIFLYQHEPTINGIFRGQAAAYEEALASRDVHGRTRRARRITREEFPSDPGMETITEKETEPPTTPKITEPPEPGSENSVDDSEAKPSPGTQGRRRSFRKSLLKSLRISKK